jgi:hypothetical protein
MTTKPDRDANNTEASHPVNTPPQAQQDIYPEVNGRFKGMIIWLGLAFVVMVFLVQHYSGYN